VRRVVQLGERQARELAQRSEVEEAVRGVQISCARGAARRCFLELQLPQQELAHASGMSPAISTRTAAP